MQDDRLDRHHESPANQRWGITTSDSHKPGRAADLNFAAKHDPFSKHVQSGLEMPVNGPSSANQI